METTVVYWDNGKQNGKYYRAWGFSGAGFVI